MAVSNELRKLIAEAMKLRSAEHERWLAVNAAEKAHEDAQIALRAAYVKLQEEARRGFPENKYPTKRLVLIDGKAYMLDLAGSVQGNVLQEWEFEQ